MLSNSAISRYATQYTGANNPYSAVNMPQNYAPAPVAAAPAPASAPSAGAPIDPSQTSTLNGANANLNNVLSGIAANDPQTMAFIASIIAQQSKRKAFGE